MHVWWAFFYEKRVILKLRIVYTNQGERLPGREREGGLPGRQREREKYRGT